MSPSLDIEVAYALALRQRIVRLTLPEGACVADAIRASGLLSEFPEIDLARNAVGIWGKPAALDQILRARDRVEIYRPLLMDPKEARRVRAQQQRTAARQRNRRQ